MVAKVFPLNSWAALTLFLGITGKFPSSNSLEYQEGVDTTQGFSNIYSVILMSLCLCSIMKSVQSSPIQSPASSNSEQFSETSLLVSDLSFSQKLENPCALVDMNANVLRPLDDSQTGEKSAIRTSLLNELRAKTLLLKDNAQTILRTSLLEDCFALELPSVAIIPALEELEDQKPVEVFRQFYTSLMNHTAHVYFITEQLQRHDADASCGSSTLVSGARSLSSHMRELMCVLRLCTRTFHDGDINEEDSYITDSTSQILNEQLIDQPLCSRRSIRDCQTVHSTLTLLRTLSTYLRRTIDVTSSSS